LRSVSLARGDHQPAATREKSRGERLADTTLKNEKGARFRRRSLSVETHAIGRGATVPIRIDGARGEEVGQGERSCNQGYLLPFDLP